MECDHMDANASVDAHGDGEEPGGAEAVPMSVPMDVGAHVAEADPSSNLVDDVGTHVAEADPSPNMENDPYELFGTDDVDPKTTSLENPNLDVARPLRRAAQHIEDIVIDSDDDCVEGDWSSIASVPYFSMCLFIFGFNVGSMGSIDGAG